MGGKCRLGTLLRRAGPPLQAAVRMKPGYLLFAVLLTGLAAQEDDDEARKGAGVKGACKNTGPKPNPKIFAKYTIPIKNKKCPCWWDLSKKNCACCKGKAMQCGWPMHKYCYKKSKMGCPGVCNNKYTLSGKGFPCYNDKSKGNDCAWCAPGGFQCYADDTTGPDSAGGSRCIGNTKKDKKHCVSVQGDCKHITGACPGDRCQFQGKVKGKSYSQCVCPEEYEGNGIQCYSNGTLLADPDTQVELEMNIMSEEYQFPFTGQDFSNSANLELLITELEKVESNCNSADCEANLNQSETEV